MRKLWVRRWVGRRQPAARRSPGAIVTVQVQGEYELANIPHSFLITAGTMQQVRVVGYRNTGDGWAMFYVPLDITVRVA